MKPNTKGSHNFAYRLQKGGKKKVGGEGKKK